MKGCGRIDTDYKKREVGGSSPLKPISLKAKPMELNKIPNGGVAQLGEHLPCKQGVKSSNLSISIRSET